MSDKKLRKTQFVQGDYVQAQQTKVEMFDRTGNVLDDTARHKVPCYAKAVQNHVSQTPNTYYICTYQGTPLDPMGPFGRRERSLDSKMQRVSKNTFDLYLTYLKTNNSIYLTKAQRGLLND